MELRLNKNKNVKSIDTDQYLTIGVKTSHRESLQYMQNSVIDVNELYDDERQNTTKYRLYGYLNFRSLLNGLNLQYGTLKEFFIKPRIGEEELGQLKNILNSFDIYLCKAWTGNTKYTDNDFQRKFQILTNLTTLNINRAAFAKSIFFEQIYTYNFQVDIDTYGQYDSFGKPILDLYLFINYKPTGNETVRKKTFSLSGNVINTTLTANPYQTYTAGQIIDSDLVYYDVANYTEDVMVGQIYYIKCPCLNEFLVQTHLEFKYNPFYRIPLQYFSSETSTGNISGKTENDFNIPEYAVKLDNYGNYIWKDILPHGFFDPLTNEGVNHSFVNKKHYVFTEVMLDVPANTNDSTTVTNLGDIILAPNEIVKNNPDIGKLSKKC